MSTDIVMTEAEARAVLAQLREATPEGVAAAVARLYEAGAWRALGYASWRHLCTEEIRPITARLAPAQRGEALTALRSEGIPNKAALSALGIAALHTMARPAGPVPAQPETKCTAALWSAFLGVSISSADVANLMDLRRIARRTRGSR